MKLYYQRLKELRKEMNASQADVAEKCGMSQKKLSRLENGKIKLKLSDLKALCLYYKLSSNYILGLPEDLNYPEK